MTKFPIAKFRKLPMGHPVIQSCDVWFTVGGQGHQQKKHAYNYLIILYYALLSQEGLVSDDKAGVSWL